MACRQFFRAVGWAGARAGSDRFALTTFARRDDVAGTFRELQALRSAGAIDEQTYQTVVGALRRERPTIAPNAIPIELARPAAVVEPPPLPAARVAAPIAATAAPAPAAQVAAVATPQRARPIPVEPIRPPEPAAPPPPPHRSVGEVFSSFMEESNIRWGELVGAILMVGCSIALVVTFWQEISARPNLKLLIFTSVTAAVFGAGLYTQHRWKLPTTSRGMLLAGTLLVPLNCLAIATQQGTPSPLTIVGQVLSFALFGWLVWLAGKSLADAFLGNDPPVAPSSAPVALSLGVVGTSVCQAIINRIATHQASMGMLVLLAGLPLAFYWLSTGLVLNRCRREAAIPGAAGSAILTFLGLVSAAVIFPIGLLLLRSDAWAVALRNIAPVIGIAGVPALSTGLLLARRLRDGAMVRFAAMAAGVAGAAVLICGIVLGWPDPAVMIPAAVLDFAILYSIAFIFDLPAAHLLALPCMAWAYILGAHLVMPHGIGWRTSGAQLVGALASGATGTLLVPLVGVLAGAAAILRQRGRRADAFFHTVIAGAAGVASVAMVTLHGLGARADHGATWVYAIYGALALAGGLWMRRDRWIWAASLLLAAAFIQGIVFRYPPVSGDAQRWIVALLGHASLLTLFAVPLVMRRKGDDYAESLCASLMLSSGVGALLILIELARFHAPFASLARETFWVAGVWLVIAIARRYRPLFSAAQVATFCGVAMVVLAAAQAQPWFKASAHPVIDPRVIQGQGVALALACIVWAGIRWLAGLRGQDLLGIGPLLRPAEVTVERVMVGVLIAAFGCLSVFAAGPGIGHELMAATGSAAVGELHALAAQSGSWMFFIALLVAIVVQGRRLELVSILLTLYAATLLLAARFEAATSTASAWRWLCAGLMIAGSVPAWIHPARNRQLLWILLPAMIAPIVSITLDAATSAFLHVSTVGPAAGTFFSRIGDSANYLLPLVASTAVLVAHSVRQRAPALAFCGGLMLNLTVSLAYPLWLMNHRYPFNSIALVRLMEFNAIASAGFALAWVAVQRWRRAPVAEAQGSRTFIRIQVGIAALALLIVLVPAEVGLVVSPGDVSPAASVAANQWAILGWVMAAAAMLMVTDARRIPPGAIVAAILIFGSLIAVHSARPGAGWLAYHLLLVSRAMGGWLVLAIGWASTLRGLSINESDDTTGGGEGVLAQFLGWRDQHERITFWASALGAIVMALAMRAGWDDPARPWWSIAGLLAASVLSLGLCLWTAHRRWLYPAGILTHIAALIWFIAQGYTLSGPVVWNFIDTHVIILAGCGLGALLLDRMYLCHVEEEHIRFRGGYHHPAAILCTVAMAFIATISLLGDAVGFSTSLNAPLAWGALGVTCVLLAACLYDAAARYAIFCLYVLGLVIAANVMDMFDLKVKPMTLAGSLVLCAYAVAWGYGYLQRKSLLQIAASAGIPRRANWPAGSPRWLAGLTAVQSLLVTAAAWWLVSDLAEFPWRLAIGAAPLLMGVAIGLVSHDRPADFGKRFAIALGAIGTVLWLWGWLDPLSSELLLNRMVLTFAALAAMAAGCALAAARIADDDSAWAGAAGGMIVLFAAAAGLVLMGILGAEASLYNRALVATTGRAVPMAWAAVASVGVTLVALGIAAVMAALLARRDPLDLSERGRTSYIYFAELTVVLVLVHVRLCMPYLLDRGFWTHYWPLILLALALFSATASEIFHRRRRIVVDEPLRNTAAVLPAVATILYWPLAGTWHHLETVPYALVLCCAGLFYATLAFLRRSFFFGILACIAGNAALWWVLGHSASFGFAQHPQLWLIPAALSLLAASELSGAQLSAPQTRLVRYIALLVVYVSSTADIWLNFQQAPWLSLVLALLAATGVLLGIAMRIQSFLFLGTLFLLVAISSMIHYATMRLHHNWPWYVAGIFVGMAIVLTFALFEKKRAEMMRLMEDVRRWQ